MKPRYRYLFCLIIAQVLLFLPCIALCQEELPQSGDPMPYAYFGASVSVYADFAIAGAYFDDLNGADSGAAYVYKYDASGAGWGEVAKLPNDADNFSDFKYFFSKEDRFGHAAAMDETYVVIGAPYDDPDGVGNAGAAYVFQREGGDWLLKARLTASNKQINSEFGAAVAIEDQYVLVGSPKNDLTSDSNIKNAGAVYVFERPDGGWADMTETAQLRASEPKEYASFGKSLSLSGNVALIGAPDEATYQGAAYMFTRSQNGNWSSTRLTAQDGAPNDRFGACVAVSGTRAAVGAPYYGGNAGAIYPYVHDGGSWVASDPIESPLDKGFGFAAAIKGDMAVFGAYNSFNVTELGHYGNAYVYKYTGGAWTQKDNVGQGYGYSVDVSNFFVIGGDRERYSRQGAAFIQPISNVDNLPPFVYELEDVAIAMSDAEDVEEFKVYDRETPEKDLDLELICPEICLPDPNDPDNDPNLADPMACNFDLNKDCVPNITATLSWTGETWQLATTTPSDNAVHGKTDSAVLKVTDGGGLITETDFSITVDAPPTINSIADQTMRERTADNPSTMDVSFTASDDVVNVIASSNNQGLVPDANLIVDLEKSVVRITPKLNQSGEATITLSAIDAVGNTAETDFKLLVDGLPDIAGLSSNYRVPLNEQPAPDLITFTISDEDPPADLNVTVEIKPKLGDNLNLLDGIPTIQDGASADEKIIDLAVADGESGSMTIRVKVEDSNGGIRTQTFQLVVDGTSPQIVAVSENEPLATNVTMNEGDIRKQVKFAIIDTDTSIGAITKTAASDDDNKDWLPAEKFSISCSTFCTLSIYPPDEGEGTADITLTVNDNDDDTENGTHTISFTFNRKPVITPLSEIEINEGNEDEEAKLNFSFNVSSDASELNVKATNVTNKELFTNIGVACADFCDLTSFITTCTNGTNGDCEFNADLPANEWGAASIIVTAKDEQGLSGSESFALTVNDVNDTPELTIPSGSEFKEDANVILDIVVSDDDGDQLALNVASLNEDVIPNTFQNLKICEKKDDASCASPPGSGWSSVDAFSVKPNEDGVYNPLKLFIRPDNYANGDAIVKVSLTDGEISEPIEKEFTVTVTAVENSPILSVAEDVVPMDDNRDEETAKEDPIPLEIIHPDGGMNLDVSVVLPGDSLFNTENVYFIDGNGNTIEISIEDNTIKAEEIPIQDGKTLSLGLVLIPTPNVIPDVKNEEIEIKVSDGVKSDSATITAQITPINDPPIIMGLQPQYPCVGCLPDAEPPWLQDEEKIIRFQVKDNDPQDDSESLTVTAKWAPGVDPNEEYTPQLVSDITQDGQVNLLVEPPAMISGWLNLTVTVADQFLAYSQDTVINIKGVNYPPKFEDPVDAELETNEGGSVEVVLTVSDAETARLSKLTLLKEWISVDPDNMPSGTFTGGEISDQGRATLVINPPDDWPNRLDAPAHARIRLTIQEPDGTLSSPAVIDLYIQGVPDAPVITPLKSVDPPPKIDEGGAYTLDFRVEDVDTPVADMSIKANYDPGVTDLVLNLSTPVCSDETEHKKKCRITAKGADQSFGEATISLSVQDDTPADFQGPLSADFEFSLTVQEINDPPTFQITEPLPLPIVVIEDGSASAYYDITDPDPNASPTDLKVIQSSLQWDWTDSTTPTAPVELTLAGDSILIAPKQNGFGRGVVSFDFTDGTNTVSDSFDVKVTPENDAPTLEFTSSPASPLDEDATANLTFSVGDVETPVSNLILTYTITWTEGGDTETLSPYSKYILVTGTGANKTMQFTPPAGRPVDDKAVAIITATVKDRDNENPGQDVEQAVVEYLAKNDPPVIVKKNGISVETIEEDFEAFYVEFTVSDQETAAGSLITTTPVISGNNPALLPEGSYVFEPGETTRRLKLTPAPNENGQVDITVSVLDAPAPDGLESAPLTFTLVVTPVPDPPTISTLRKEGSVNQETQIILDEGQTTADLADTYIVEVDDPDTALSSLIVGATWAPAPGKENNYVEGDIRLEGTAETRVIFIEPAEHDSGYARITPWVKDGAGAAPVKSQPFELRVDPVNNAPIINAPIPNPEKIIFVQGNEEYFLCFEVWDGDSPAQNIQVSAESGNADLLPQTDKNRFDWATIDEFNNVPCQGNMTHALMMKPLPLGGTDPVDVPVTIQATDQENFTEFDFTLRIFPDVTPPKIRIRETVSIYEDPAASEEVTFWVWDEKKKPQELEVFVSSGQTDHIPNSNITFKPISEDDPEYDPSPNADNWRLTFKPAQDAPFQEDRFTTQLIVSVNNGLFETAAEPPLSVTIHNRNDAPTISAIPNQEVHLNQTVTVNFTVDDVDEGPDNIEVSAAADPDIAQFEFTNGDTTGEPTKPYVKDWTLKVIPSATTEAEKTFTVTITATDTSGVTAPSEGEDGNTGYQTFTINMAGVAPGDVDGSGTIDLADAIAALQILAGIQPTSAFAGADIDNNGQVGFAEALNALRTASGL